jgi:hypothetical protein
MKTISAILPALCVSTPWTSAQTAAAPLPVSSVTTGQSTLQDTPYLEVDRGANHRVWQKTEDAGLPLVGPKNPSQVLYPLPNKRT